MTSTLPKSAALTFGASITFTQAMTDPGLFGPWFSPPESWATWRVVGKAIFGERMMPVEAEIFAKYTGRRRPPTKAASEAWLAIGRRGGKGWFSAAVAVYRACLRPPRLKPGELGLVMVLAADRDQAGETFRYISELIASTPLLASMVVSSTKQSIDLNNRVQITVQTASFRRIRGRKVIAAICDEIAFWYAQEASANPDHEILTALRPSMLGVPGALLLCISSPYGRRGSLWQTHQGHFGQDDDPVLVWKAPTEAMYPGVDRTFLAREYERDPVAARAEYGAEFREDIEAFVSPEAVARVVVPGRTEVPWVAGHDSVAFVDTSGGSQDSMTFAIAHPVQRDGHCVVVLDRIGEVRAPLSPHAVVARFVPILKTYGIRTVTGDRYAGEWPREAFREHGIYYRPSDPSRSDLYRDLLPLITSGRVELLDHPRLIAQLVALERRETASGHDSITHPPGAHDDLANAVAGAVVAAARPPYRLFLGSPPVSSEERDCRVCGGRHLKEALCPAAAPTVAQLRASGYIPDY